MADYAGAVAAIETRLSSNWTTTPIGFENSDDPVQVNGSGDLAPWVFCEIVSDRASIRGAGKPGSHVVIDEGFISATVFVPVGSGRATARQYAVSIGEIFRTKEFYNSDAGACVRTWTPEIGPGNPATSENPSGNWWAVTVTIPFEFFHLA